MPLSTVRPFFLVCLLVAAGGSVYGCSNLNMHCDTAGKGYECTSVDEPPDRHTRSKYQPPWSDEFHDVGTDRPQVGAYVFERTNEVRRQEGGSSLRRDTTLTQIACWHNRDMLGHNYMGHKDSDDRLPADRVAREHRRLIGTVGENVLEGGRLDASASDDRNREWANSLLNIWLESPGHRSNMLSEDWTHLGTCVSQDATVGRATQLFADVSAYLENPLPWALTPGDSVSVSFTLVKADHTPTRYEFVPAGEPLEEAFSGEGWGKPVEEKIYLPQSTGTYGLRVLIPDNSGRYAVLGGPRVLVKKKDEPAY